MVCVLFVSRHKPVPIQFDYLEDKLGEPVTIKILSRTFTDANEIFKEIVNSGCKYAILVLPLSLIMQLLRLNKTLPKEKQIVFLWNEMEKIAEYSPNVREEDIPDFNPYTDALVKSKKLVRHFRFRGIYKIKRVELELEPL